jgi:CDP-glucose 4,6-dehydratase
MEENFFWQEKNVLITGINGFIGGNLAQGCLSKGAKVFGILRNMNKESFLFLEGLDNRVTLIKGDVTDKELLRSAIVEQRINICFHLAAQVEVGLAATYPYLTWETNIKGTYALLEAIRDNRETIEAVIIASTDKAYGSYPEDKLPYLEEYPLIPVFPYDVSKACADMIARSYASELYRLPIIITRFCNIYGPGQLNFSALIPDAVRAALGYGQFLPRGNGLHIRDYIYIDDVINLYLLFAERLALDQKLIGEVFNAGTNQPKRVKDIVETIFNLIKKQDQYRLIREKWSDHQTTGEILYQYMGYEKLNTYFGWRPKVEFEQGLQTTVSWYDKYFNRKK